MLWRYWLGGRKGIRPVKTEHWGAGMVICLERGADLRMSSWCHCHSLSLASVKSRLVLPFWYWPTQVLPDKGPLNGCVWSTVGGIWSSTNNWCLLVCMEKQVIWSEIDITLRNFERSYHLNCWQWLNLDTEFIVHIWLNWFHDSTAYISSSGNDMSHICGRSPYLRCISCTRRRVQSAELASLTLSLIHIWRCRRLLTCRSRWSPYH